MDFQPLSRRAQRAARSLACLPPDLALDLVITALAHATRPAEVRTLYRIGLVVIHQAPAPEGRAAA